MPTRSPMLLLLLLLLLLIHLFFSFFGQWLDADQPAVVVQDALPKMKWGRPIWTFFHVMAQKIKPEYFLWLGCTLTGAEIKFLYFWFDDSSLLNWTGCGVARTQFPRLQKWCSWPAPIWILVMPLHSTGVQWSAPWQGHAWLIARSPLPGKYNLTESVSPRRLVPSADTFLNVGLKKEIDRKIPAKFFVVQ